MESLAESDCRSNELQRLLDAIAAGTLADADELDLAEQALLRAAFSSDEDLQVVFDRIRAQGPEER